MSEEQTITINGEAYKISEFSKEAISQIESIRFTESEINRANAMVAVMTTAKAGYEAELAKLLPKKSVK